MTQNIKKTVVQTIVQTKTWVLIGPNRPISDIARVDPIIEKVIKLQLHIMASMKSYSHRTFIKGSSMELNFYEKFFLHHEKEGKNMFQKLTWKKNWKTES